MIKWIKTKVYIYVPKRYHRASGPPSDAPTCRSQLFRPKQICRKTRKSWELHQLDRPDMQDNPILFNLDITFNQVVRGSSPRCPSNDMVCKDHQKKSSSTTFFCGVKLPLFTSSIDIILSLYVTQYAASKKLLGLLKIFVYSVFNLVFS